MRASEGQGKGRTHGALLDPLDFPGSHHTLLGRLSPSPPSMHIKHICALMRILSAPSTYSHSYSHSFSYGDTWVCAHVCIHRHRHRHNRVQSQTQRHPHTHTHSVCMCKFIHVQRLLKFTYLRAKHTLLPSPICKHTTTNSHI